MNKEEKEKKEVKSQERLEELYLKLVGLKEKHKKTFRGLLKKHTKEEKISLKKECALEKARIKSTKNEIKQFKLLLKLPRIASPIFIARIYTKSSGWKDVKIPLDETGQFEFGGGLYTIDPDSMEWLPKNRKLYRVSMYIEGDPNPRNFKEEREKLEVAEHSGDRKIVAEMRSIWLAFVGNLIEKSAALKKDTTKSTNAVIALLVIILIFSFGSLGYFHFSTEKIMERTEVLTEAVANITKTPPLAQPCICPCCAVSQFVDIFSGCQLALTECQSGLG